MDRLTPEQRSRNMAAVRSKHSVPELAVRRALFAAGFRYRLHRSDLPGTPDIVLPKYSAVIFVHGCFWHQHSCHRSAVPETRQGWWHAKLSANRQRDAKQVNALVESGWRVLLVWECALKAGNRCRENKLSNLISMVKAFLIADNRLMELPSVNISASLLTRSLEGQL